MHAPFLRSLPLAITAIFALYISVPQLSRGQVTPHQLVHPFFVAIDSQGHVYVSEPEKNRIQKFDSAGNFLAQWGSFGSADGQFNSPQGIVLDSLGNVYVADSGNSRIQKFNANGGFLGKWGTFGTLDTQFHTPMAIALDAANNVYVTDADLKRVQVFNSAGIFLRSWGGSIGTGDGQFSPFQGPLGIAVDTSDNVYVSDTGTNRIQKFTNTGAFLGWAGRCTSGANCDPVSQRSLGFRCTASTCSAPASGSSDGQFLLPTGLAVDSLDNIYVADWVNDRIQKFDSADHFMTKWGSRGRGDGQFRAPIGLGVGLSNNDIYVADTGNNRIQQFTDTGTLIAMWGADMDLLVSASPDPITVLPSQSKTSTLTVESVNKFSGPVKLTATCCFDASASVRTAPTGFSVQLASDQVTVPAGGSTPILLAITTSSSPSFGKFVALIEATNSDLSISRTVGVTFSIVPPPDITLSVSATSLSMFPSQTAKATIKIESNNQFSGDVDLTTSFVGTSPKGLNVQIIPSRLALTSGSSSTATLHFTTMDLPSAGTFTVRVKGVNSTLNLTRTVDVSIDVSCACTETGPFENPEVVQADTSGFSPNSAFQVKPYFVGTTPYIQVVRTSNHSVVVPGTINPAAWGFSPNSQFFVIASNFNGNLSTFDLRVYDLGQAKKTIDTTISFCADTATIACIPLTRVCNCSLDKGNEAVSIDKAGWGFSPDGKTFLLAYAPKPATAKFLLTLYSSETGAPVLSTFRNEWSAFWQFSPCSDLLMLVTQPGTNPTTTDPVIFYSTRQSNTIYHQLMRKPPDNPSARIAKAMDTDYRILLTGMGQSNFSSPQCTP